MPPLLALFLCIIVVAGLLWIDRKRSMGQSSIVWLPTLWMLYCASRPVSFWFQGGQATGIETNLESGNALERNLLSTFIFLGTLALSRRRMDWSSMVRENRWLLFLFFYMLISILWSDFQFVSLKRWVKTFGTVIMACVLVSETNPCQALATIFRRTAYILIPFSAMLVKYYPRLGVSYGRWTGGTTWLGVSMTKNTLGALCMVCVFFLVWSIVRRWQGKESLVFKYQTLADWLVLGLALWLLRGPGGAYSATSLAVLLLGIILFFILRRYSLRGSPAWLVAKFSFLAACLLLLPILIFDASPIALVASILGRDPTLTGRTDLIWNVLLPIAFENILLGVGYGAFWIRPVEEFEFDMVINEAHNGYLDVFMELGAVGLLLLCLLLVTFLIKAEKEFARDRDWAALRMSFLLMIIIHNCTETSFLRSTMLLWNVLIFLMVVYPMRIEAIQPGEVPSTLPLPLQDETRLAQ